MLRRTFAVFCMLSMLFTFFSFGGTAAASSSTPSFTNIETVQGNCAIIDVHLNGTQHPRVTCLHKHLPKGNLPGTYQGNCDGATMEAVFGNGDGACFDGTGYLGYYMPQTTFIEILTSEGWFLWYHNSPGYFCTLHYNSNQYESYNGVDITQIDPGASHSNSVCH